MGLVYAAAVALARRAGVNIPRRVAILFYALVLLFFFKPLTGPYVNVGADVLKLIAPWSATAPPGFDKFDVGNYELQDVVFQFVPWTRQVQESWRELRVPLWNPLTAAGMPLMANMQSGALSPLRLLALPLPLANAFSAEAAFKILVALTFAFLFCRRRYDLWPSVIGAIAFGFGTFMTLWLHFPHPNVAAFLPAVLYQLDLLAERVTRGRFLFAAFLGPVLLAGGHPETAAHTVFFAALYALWIFFTVPRVPRRLKFLRTLIALSIVSLLLAAPVLLPFVEILPHSMSYRVVNEAQLHKGTAFSDFPSLALLVHPRLNGQRPGPLWGWPVTEAVAGFSGLLGFGACLAMLVRVLIGRRFREREFFFVLATLLTFAIIDDTPFVSAPVRELFSLALNSRFRLQFSFMLAVQTAALLHYARRERFLLPIAVGGSLAALGYVLLKTGFPTPETKQFAYVTTIPSLIVLALAALMLFRPLRFTALLLLVVAVYIELWTAGHSWHPVTRAAELYARTPIVDALQAARGNEPYRMVGLGGALFPNTQSMFGFEDVRVKDALASARYVDVLRRNVKDFDTTQYYWKWMDSETPLLDRLNVRWVVTEPRVDLSDRTRYRPVYEGFDGRVYENLRAQPRFFAEGARVDIAKWRGDAYELQVDAPRGALVRSSVAMWPGWRVTRDGKKLEPQLVDDAFLGFTVPPGRGTVRVRYVPMSFWGGLALSIITLIATSVITARMAGMKNDSGR
ncbi:MAG TPA: YfhO family protein [Thermoanaerobaculia bacterium]|nr:YfhO family protein [Thermoanaerobaculia bacterium]